MEWLTVKEVADYLKVSEVQVYKWLSNQEIPACKIGRLWRFSMEQIDNWIYSNQVSMHEALSQRQLLLQETLSEYHEKLKNHYQNNLFQLLLYGSWARGEANDDSDVDLLVVLNEVKDKWKEFRIIHDFAYEATYEKNRPFLFSTIIMETEKFLKEDTSFLRNVRKEGKKAA